MVRGFRPSYSFKSQFNWVKKREWGRNCLGKIKGNGRGGLEIITGELLVKGRDFVG